MSILGSLQRQSFEYLKRHIDNPCEYGNFEVHLDTYDIRRVAFFDKKKGKIEYKKEKRGWFFWTGWVCHISIDGKEVTEHNIDKAVIEDIIQYQKDVSLNYIRGKSSKMNGDRSALEELFAGEEGEK